jgi:hypothetical protein
MLPFIILSALTFTFAASVENRQQSTTPPSDCRIVIHAWNQLKKSSMPIDSDCCRMSGITCNPARSNVLKISWNAKDLAGPIPPALGNLSSLTQLYLSFFKI